MARPTSEAIPVIRRGMSTINTANVRTVVLDLVRPGIVEKNSFPFPPSVVLVLNAD